MKILLIKNATLISDHLSELKKTFPEGAEVVVARCVSEVIDNSRKEKFDIIFVGKFLFVEVDEYMFKITDDSVIEGLYPFLKESGRFGLVSYMDDTCIIQQKKAESLKRKSAWIRGFETLVASEGSKDFPLSQWVNNH